MAIPLVNLLADEFRESRWAEGRVWNLDELAAWSPTIVIDEVVERKLPLLADVSFLGPASTVVSGPRKWKRGRPPDMPENARATQSCALDQVNASPATSVVETRARDILDMEGWAVDAGSGAQARSAWMVLRDRDTILHLAVELGRQRPDVAVASGNPALAPSGYRVLASNDSVPAGTYDVTMAWVDRNGWMTCDLRRTLKVLAD